MRGGAGAHANRPAGGNVRRPLLRGFPEHGAGGADVGASCCSRVLLVLMGLSGRSQLPRGHLPLGPHRDMLSPGAAEQPPGTLAPSMKAVR